MHDLVSILIVISIFMDFCVLDVYFNVYFCALNVYLIVSATGRV